MGSLFLIIIPVRGHEFKLRLAENKLMNSLAIQDAPSDVSVNHEASLEPEDALQLQPSLAAKDMFLPDSKDKTAKYTFFRDSDKFFLEITRDTMKLTQEETAPKPKPPPARRASSLSSVFSLDNLSVNTRASASFQDTEFTEVINSHFLEKHMEDALTKFSLLTAAWEHSIDGKFSQIWFTVKADKADLIINHLHTVGIGKKYESTLSVCTATVFSYNEDANEPRGSDNEDDNEENADKEKAKGKWNNFVQSIKARLTVAQVVQNVKSNAVITFDFIVMVLVAGVIASLGLLENSSVNLVASMLISPLMGPIMAFTFGAMIRDRTLMKTGVVAEVLGLSLCLLVGLCVGIFAQLKLSRGPWADIQKWPTDEMSGRSQVRALVVGAGIAIPSGAGVALSILAGNAGSLVGVAISASLLPPCVNCGIFYGLALVIALQGSGGDESPWNVPCDEALPEGDPNDSDVDHMRNHEQIYCLNALKEFAIMGTISLCLTLLNIALIFFTGIIVLKIKEVAPHTTKSAFERFWKQDVKHARDFNLAHYGEDALLDDINETNAPKILDEVGDDFVFNQIRNRVMYRDENVLANVKEKHSKATVRPEAHPPSGGLMSWFRSAKIEDVEAVKPKPSKPGKPTKRA